MRRRIAPRLKDFSYVGRYCYFLTLCTAMRRRVFINETPSPSHSRRYGKRVPGSG